MRCSPSAWNPTTAYRNVLSPPGAGMFTSRSAHGGNVSPLPQRHLSARVSSQCRRRPSSSLRDVLDISGHQSGRPEEFER